MALSSHDADVQVLLNALGVPKHSTRVTLNIEVDEVVSIECEYYPDFNLKDGELVKVLKRYKLVEKTSDE